MNSTKRFFVVLLSLQCAFTQANTGGRCSFESAIAPDEQALLDGVKSALTPMSANAACQAQAQQIKTFEQALTAYNQQANALNSGGISCMNYQSTWNSRFDDFANNWNSPSGTDDAYDSCRSKPTRDAAIECAALITSSQKSAKRTSCEAQKDSITIAAGQELRTQTFQTGLTALNDVIANPECMNSAGERKIGLIQNAVGLASQAATIAMLGTGVGLLIGGAAQLVNAAIGNIFRNPSKQAMAVLDNRENFSKIACLYEQVESKALRCERISASRQVDVLKNMFDASAQFCETNEDVLKHNDLMTSIDSVIRDLNKAPPANTPAPTLSQEGFDALVEQLSEPFPGSEVTRLDIAEHSAKVVADRLSSALENDDNLRAYLKEKEDLDNLSGTQLRREHRDLTARRDRALAVKNVVEAVKAADSKGTQMTPEDLANVEKSLKEFNAGDASFTGVYNEIMIERASMGDDLGTSLAAYNSRLDEARLHHQRMELYSNLNRVSSSAFEDGGRFSEAKTAIAPILRRVLNKELNTLIDRVKDLSRIRPGAPDRALQETLRTQEESVIYPLLRACNQLRTVMTKTSRSGDVNATTKGQPSVCRAFNCQAGLNTFEGYLQNAGVSGINLEKCDVNCRSHYDRFVCQERSSLASVRARVRDEFLRNGTICGKSIHEAFRKADGL